MKKLIAYSSVAHMGFVTLGIFTLQQQGIEGSIIQMISHGLVSAALFLTVGVVYDRMHSRLISTYGGLVSVIPKYSILFAFSSSLDGVPIKTRLAGSLTQRRDSKWELRDLPRSTSLLCEPAYHLALRWYVGIRDQIQELIYS